MRNSQTLGRIAFAVLAVLAALSGQNASATATADEAARLKSTLTPFGAEKAGNKEGTIPEWTGGLTTVAPDFKNGGRRPDPFAGEKPLYSVTAQNVEQYGDKVSEGVKAMLRKYPKTFRVDVYPTHRTAAAPQWVYDNTFKNATNAKIVEGTAGPRPEGAYGGIPFPIAKNGVEVMWNHVLRWRPPVIRRQFNGYMMTAEGNWLKVLETFNEEEDPYYFKGGSIETSKNDYGLIRTVNSGPPIRAGEAIVAHTNIDEDKSQSWIYLTGQRRVRMLPNPCCDTPTSFTAGVVSFDELETFSGRMDRFDWKLVGKREMFIPYNSNRTMQPLKDSDVLMPGHLNPDHVRWELHRVWVVEATLKPGQRHPAAKSRYFVDEDSWIAVLGERYDAKGQLWRVPFGLPTVLPDLPGLIELNWGVYDLIGGTSYVGVMMNEQKDQGRLMAQPWPESNFLPAALTGGSLR